MKTFILTALILALAAAPVLAGTSDRAVWYHNKPGDASATYHIADFPSNANDKPAHVWDFLCLADSVQFTLYFSETWAPVGPDSMIVFRPAGVGFSSMDIGNPEVWHIKFTKNTLSAYADFHGFFKRN